MEKVYIISLMYCDGYGSDIEFKVASTKEKAKEVLNNWALEEEQLTWIGDYEQDELDEYEFSEEYFDAQYGEKRTTIWITEKEVL